MAIKGKSSVIEDMRKELEALKAANKKEVDDTVCPECGADLTFVEDNVVYCKKCDEYYEVEEEEEE